MKEPLFKIGQRVYNRANPYHGKVTHIYPLLGCWHYTVLLDLPNRSNEYIHEYAEEGLRATLEEAVAWQQAEMGAWRCTICYQPNGWGAAKCAKCGRSKPT